MPHGKIFPYHALKTLTQLHAELAGKLAANQRETKRLRLAILQVEAVMKMLSPDVDLRLITPKRPNVGNPWFKRGTLSRATCSHANRRNVKYVSGKPSNQRWRARLLRRLAFVTFDCSGVRPSNRGERAVAYVSHR